VSGEITGGGVSDYKGYDLVMQADAPSPKVLLADRGYDSNHIRTDLAARGATPMIPRRKTRKVPIPVDDFIYGLRNRVERAINKLKCSRRLATCYDKTEQSYLGFIHLARIRIWIRHFVNRA
jgi:transposase